LTQINDRSATVRYIFCYYLQPHRFNRWSRRGIWKKIFDTLAAKSRDSLYLIDSTIVKAHRAASGAKGGRKIKPSASVVAVEPRKSMPRSIAKAGH